jgi:uncharacterized damage-inducible protein DinB
MDLRVYAEAMANYNAWMNESLYGHAATLTDADRKKDLGAFFKSLHGTFNHLMVADIAWMQRFKREPLTKRVIGQELFADFEEMRAARREMDAQILQWSAALKVELQDTQFRFVSMAGDRERVMPYWVAVTHMFNHQTHHRGQATTLLMQLGIDPGATDLPWIPYFD